LTSPNDRPLALTGLRAPDYNGALVAPMAGRRDRQDAWEGYGTAWSIMGTLLAGLGVWGGLGYLVDRLTGFHGVFLAIGLVLGAAGGVYLVIARYGKDRQR